MAGLLTLGLVVALLVSLIAIPIVTMIQEKRGDRRRILADGTIDNATIAAITDSDQNGNCSVTFSFTPTGARRPIRVTQKTTVTAVDSASLATRSTVQIHYIPTWPRCAFIDALTLAERIRPAPEPGDGNQESRVCFIAYSDPTRSAFAPGSTANGYRWFGSGDITITADSVRFVAKQRRRFFPSKRIDRAFPLNAVTNVEVLGNAVSLEILEPDQPARTLKFWTVDATQATEIAKGLPKTTTEAFSPTMAEAAAFSERLNTLAPTTPVTYAIVAINIAVFLIAVAFGAGLFVPNPEVLVHFGTNYTPLTVGGQWWRLITNTFLHFGLVHVAFNMWAIAINGPLAERIYGSARYLVIYVCAGLTGSLASLWWHPVINSAGASGAIFGIFGALLAFFVQKKDGVPGSVIKRYRNSVAVFIAYNLLNGLSHQGIDNAAHLGGLTSGFLLGFLLARPLSDERGPPDRERRWAGAIAAAFLGATLTSFVRSPSTTALLARTAESMSSGARIASRVPKIVPHPTLTTFWGVRLGETRAELERAKGRAVKVDGNVWIYNSRTPGDDGLVEVAFKGPGIEADDTVVAVFYQGDYASAPSDLIFCIGVSRELLTEQFHAPVWTAFAKNGSEYEMFEDGLTANLWHDQTVRYGIQAYYLAQSR